MTSDDCIYGYAAPNKPSNQPMKTSSVVLLKPGCQQQKLASHTSIFIPNRATNLLYGAPSCALASFVSAVVASGDAHSRSGELSHSGRRAVYKPRRRLTLSTFVVAPWLMLLLLVFHSLCLSPVQRVTAYQVPSLYRAAHSSLDMRRSTASKEAPYMFTKSSSASRRSKQIRILQSSPSLPRRIRIQSPRKSATGTAPSTPLQNRGVLGFQLNDNDESNKGIESNIQSHRETRLQAASGSSSSSMSRSSNGDDNASRPVSSVDARAWNLPQALSVDPSVTAVRVSSSTGSSSSAVAGSRYTRNLASRLESSSRQGLAESDSDSTLSTTASTTATAATLQASIPWIPDATDVESLTVLQLKEELGVRALKKTGHKADLQQRLMDWCIEQRRRQNLLRRGAVHAGDLTSLNLRSAYSVGGTGIGSGSTGSGTSSSHPVPPIATPTPTFEHELLSWNIEASPLLNKPPGASQNDVSKRAGQKGQQQHDERLQVDSLAEWARTVDLKPLLNRRQAIHREKLEGKKTVKKSSKLPLVDAIEPSDYLAVLKKMFDTPSSPYSNREVKQMYAAAKHADQMGDRELCKRILMELKVATPNDARIYRRLARMEQEDGHLAAARSVLQEGLRLHPENAFLWHGLGQLEGSIGNEALQKKYWERAIDVDPTIPHSYHALGTLEHTQGRVANAMRILKQGLEYCPTNHRLHHALGDLYRDAKMLSMASTSYLKAIKHGPVVGHGFAYTALAYVAYEEGLVEKCRHWLHKAVRLNNGRHANGWVSLAQLEESEGRIDAARSACIAGIGQYERGLLERYSSRKSTSTSNAEVSNNDKDTDRHNDRIFLEDPVALKNSFLKAVPSYRSGDRFFNVYRNWLRLEERYGTLETVEEVYNRAAVAFRHEWKLSLDMAQYFAKLNLAHRARYYFAEACSRAGNSHADPYRLFAEFECSRRDFLEARKILYSGVVALSQSPSHEKEIDRGAFAADLGMAELFLTWAVCEWQLSNYFHAQKLFAQALLLTTSTSSMSRLGSSNSNTKGGSGGGASSKLRSLILYVLARFEHYRGEHQRAQHYIGLCLQENDMPGGSVGQAKVWDLWAVVAHEMESHKLALQCQIQADVTRNKSGGVDTDVSRTLDEATPVAVASTATTATSSGSGSSGIPDVQQMMRRDPWHAEIFGASTSDASSMSSSLLHKLSFLPERRSSNERQSHEICHNADSAVLSFR